MNNLDAEIAGWFEQGFVETAAGRRLPTYWAVGQSEGQFIRKLIEQDTSITKTLEIGCALGISSYFICSALRGRDALHIIIDPAQSRDFDSFGTGLLDRSGLKFYTLRERPSEFELPRLAEDEPGAFDLVFIDGFHTFDHTMIDLFFADRLVRAGGYIVVDDCTWKSVGKAVRYFSSLPAYQLHSAVGRPFWRAAVGRALDLGSYLIPHRMFDPIDRDRFPSMVALQKVAPNERVSDRD